MHSQGTYYIYTFIVLKHEKVYVTNVKILKKKLLQDSVKSTCMSSDHEVSEGSI